MKDLTTKGLGGVSGISKLFNFGKVNKAEAKFGNIKMTGVYSGSSEYATKSKSSCEVPQYIIDKYAGVTAPKGKPTQLVIGDDYNPDGEYVDAEV